MEWARILAYITGTVDQELLLRNEYLAAENRILRGQLKGRLKLSDAERAKLGEIGRRQLPAVGRHPDGNDPADFKGDVRARHPEGRRNRRLAEIRRLQLP